MSEQLLFPRYFPSLRGYYLHVPRPSSVVHSTSTFSRLSARFLIIAGCDDGRSHSAPHPGITVIVVVVVVVAIIRDKSEQLYWYRVIIFFLRPPPYPRSLTIGTLTYSVNFRLTVKKKTIVFIILPL